MTLGNGGLGLAAGLDQAAFELRQFAPLLGDIYGHRGFDLLVLDIVERPR